MREPITTIPAGLLLVCAWLNPAAASPRNDTPQAAAPAAPIRIVAAENMWGALAERLGGEHVRVRSILSNPDQDPHLFEVSPGVARAVAGADIVIRNGIGYDPWMKGLLAARGKPPAEELCVADLAGRHDGDNPHLWYDPAVMPMVARALSARLAKEDPADSDFYAERLQQVLAAIAPVSERVAAMRARFAGTPVTATEPVFGLMAEAIGLDMRNRRFQLAVMNDTEPAASDVAAMETDLRQHRVRLLIFNSQASDSAADRLKRIALQSGVPVVGVSETEPAGESYESWMLRQLDAVASALQSGQSGRAEPAGR
ncbi:zinc ABC transporter substrate-binding protein [Acetobacteraceae bacterium KSS8]|uniref:Zinc ABC transporter substrate-binding protein n=1 Tax=Endosaccharibacter trunci TaxID=2812733 RepID=A0ABT1W862_9PROT|nr:zinc ABC transporter substrate-binding protein [Acetobacteraceae bacterium KSS8]